MPGANAEAYTWCNVSVIENELAKKERDLPEKLLTPQEKERGQKRSTELFNEIEARTRAAGKSLKQTAPPLTASPLAMSRRRLQRETGIHASVWRKTADAV